ncbi:MAG: DUF2071 domain-containing protein [Polyangiaceae bacterium]
MTHDDSRPAAQIAALAALAGAPAGLSPQELIDILDRAGLAPDDALEACEAMLTNGELIARGGTFELSSNGAHALLAIHAEIERALDPSPSTPGMEECPSIPWLTTVQTAWIDAVSINYAVDVDALRPLIPEPLEPEIFHGTAWVQVLMSRLRDMRPQGTLPMFGVNFHQVSYRAAVRYRTAQGWRRGRYFVRSETDNGVMRAVGNTLVEFKFHDFGLARMLQKRDGHRLSIDVKPAPEFPFGDLQATFDTRPIAPPRGSVWGSLDELREPLVECYDAFGVDAKHRFVYVLTIDRQPWKAQFVKPESLRCDFHERGPLGNGASRLDSVLHIPTECAYRWRPLRRERW